MSASELNGPCETTVSKRNAELSPWFVALENLSGVIDWAAFWGNNNPVELDVGCGRGLFTCNAAIANPEVNYLGIELDYKEARRAAGRLKKRNVPNARIIGGDATVMLRTQIVPHSVQAVHVYFPDPWWKRRHMRRRLFTDEFVGWSANILQHGGYLHSWTDVGEYFEVIAALMNHHPLFHPLAPPEERQPEHPMDYLTSFERKKRMIGCTIHRGKWQRRASEASQHDGP